MNTRARAEELAKRPYLIATSLEETTDGQPIYVARVLEIEGCFGQGETREAAIEDLRLAMVDYIASLLEDGLPVPEPTPLVTLKTAAQGTFTFIQQGKTLLPKPTEIYRDVYFLPAQTG
ncbi:MAG: type II toxin-antitoxin system HicB family antitoxin [Chloroflexota bacterium]